MIVLSGKIEELRISQVFCAGFAFSTAENDAEVLNTR